MRASATIKIDEDNYHEMCERENNQISAISETVDTLNRTTVTISDSENVETYLLVPRSHCGAMLCCACTKLAIECQSWFARVLTVILIVICLSTRASEIVTAQQPKDGSYSLGNCKVAINEPCPYPDINFYLYTRNKPEYPQPVHIGNSIDTSNITKSGFDYRLPTKIIIHGYNSDMFLSALVEIKRQYLRCSPHNVFSVDWQALAPSPCYISAIYNLRQVGKCTAELVDRIKELGAVDIHLIGFSLGAHATNYVANTLRPYKLPRITGLDPAMPGFTFVSKENKLDAGDAEFVDVIHTNAFIQGKVETSGHVDFYMNGGVIQPGCWAENRFFACNHHRAPLYFAESITSTVGFWGWPCKNYFMYLIGQCPPVESQIIAGEHVNATARGMHLVITGSVSPFAVGKFTGPAIEIKKNQSEALMIEKLKDIVKYKKEVITECTDAEGFVDTFTPSSDFMFNGIEVFSVK